ncbi:MAG TPA: DUF2726 domain-containing protein [Anaerolineae bacterium]|nr:DUF2726 domain-containing protein [Anaerolineae bacterium]HOR00344.1 DUF2726 domain-containing protein [Anaerolineae bacterium]HPL26932.1 DUF2726 domain-containing protein [Anaerolineae bacterium]
MNDSMLVFAAALSAVAALASLAGLFAVLRQRISPAAEPAARADAGSPLPYRRVEALLAPSERALYNVLLPLARAHGAAVFVKVHLADLVQVRRGARAYERHVDQIGKRRVDVVLCDEERLVPLVAVQLDGTTRGAASRGKQDELIAETLAAVGLPLVRLPARASYQADEVAALVEVQLAPQRHEPPALPGATDAVLEPPAGWLPSLFDSTAQANAQVPEPLPGEEAAALVEAPPAALGTEADADIQVPALLGVELPAEAEPTEPEHAAPAEPALSQGTPVCPDCGHALMEMQDIDTGEIVLACSRYPECQYYHAQA